MLFRFVFGKNRHEALLYADMGSSEQGDLVRDTIIFFINIVAFPGAFIPDCLPPSRAGRQSPSGAGGGQEHQPGHHRQEGDALCGPQHHGQSHRLQEYWHP